MLLSLLVVTVLGVAWNLIRRRPSGGSLAAHQEGVTTRGELVARREEAPPERRWRLLRGLVWGWRAGQAVTRFVARHRVVLTPVLAGAAVWLSGWGAAAWTTAGYPWWVPLPVALLVTWLLGVWARRAEAVPVWLVSYPALVAAVWVWCAAAWPPPHQLSLGVGVALFAAAWWSHRDVRALIWWQIRVQYWLAWWPHALRAVGKPGVKIKRVTKEDPAGKETIWRGQCPPGVTVEQLHSMRDVVESAMRWPRGVIREFRPAPVRDSSQFDMVRKDVDAERLLPITDLPIEGLPRSIYDPFLVGVDESGTYVTVTLATRESGIRHVLAGGTTDEGKSTLLGDYLLQLFGCEDAVVVGLDRKGCIEIRNGAQRMARLAQGSEEGTILLEAIGAMIDASGSLIPPGQRVMTATPENPALVVVVDELARWMAMEEGNQRAVRAVETIVTSGRAAMVGLIAATNSPSIASVRKGEVRGSFDVLHIFHGTRAVWRNIIHESARFIDYTQLTGRGRHYLQDGRGTQPRLVRAFNNRASRVASVAAETADSAPALHALRVQAAGEAWATAPGRLPDELLPYLSEAQREEVFRLRALSPLPDGEPRQQPVVVPITGGGQRARRTAEGIAALTQALADAGDDGCSPEELVKGSGMSRPWVNRQLEALVGEGLVERVGRGRYRSAGVGTPALVAALVPAPARSNHGE
jgi:S-DNA-T family DNA segregation ATPase FtsK/SpoIIIE